ncbi:MAG: hypothetical protein HZA95_03920 [Candidatus Vogelbacteria bacterium]|nr:hypothetical protein [Candidatus Vogelbacteria bacterium]
MFNIKKAIGYGALLWLVMFAIISATLPSYNSYWWMTPVMSVVGLMLAYVFSRYENPKSINAAFSYGATFVVVGLILDYLVSYQFVPGLFNDTIYWLSYLLILIAPELERTLRVPTKKR